MSLNVYETIRRSSELIGTTTISLDKFMGGQIRLKPFRLDGGGLVRVTAGFGSGVDSRGSNSGSARKSNSNNRDRSNSPRIEKGVFSEGDKVEARYRGKSKYYSGVIGRVRVNGTYDINYDDGEKELGVQGELIKSLGGGGGDDYSSNRPPVSPRDNGGGKMKEGDKVEARYRGKTKYYPGGEF